jgi:C-terminal binding protein
VASDSPPFRVVVIDFLDDDLAPEREVLGDLAEVTALNASSVDELPGHIEDADALMMFHYLEVGREVLERLNKCRLIVRCGVGFDNVDIRAAKELGIPVANIPDYGTEEVADAAIGLSLDLLRKITFLNRHLQSTTDDWHYQVALPIRRLRGMNCGVIGCGRIGTAFALRAKAFGMNVQFYDPYLPDGADKALGISRCETLTELLGSSDLVSVHCPLTAETHAMIDLETLSQMKQGAYLVNTARGSIVDHRAVLTALETGQLAGAALDVLSQEPPAQDDPVLAAWRNPEHPAHFRLILNPHSAFYSRESLLDMRTKGAQNIRRVFTGNEPRNVINP